MVYRSLKKEQRIVYDNVSIHLTSCLARYDVACTLSRTIKGGSIRAPSETQRLVGQPLPAPLPWLSKLPGRYKGLENHRNHVR
jgi:hypothetical protein